MFPDRLMARLLPPPLNHQVIICAAVAVFLTKDVFFYEYSYKNTGAVFVRLELREWQYSNVALFDTTNINWQAFYLSNVQRKQ